MANAMLDQSFARFGVEFADGGPIARIHRLPLPVRTIEKTFVEEIANALLEADRVAAHEGVNEIRWEIAVAVEQFENLDVARTEHDRLPGALSVDARSAFICCGGKLHTWGDDSRPKAKQRHR